jgi:hypothetical protein
MVVSECERPGRFAPAAQPILQCFAALRHLPRPLALWRRNVRMLRLYVMGRVSLPFRFLPIAAELEGAE